MSCKIVTIGPLQEFLLDIGNLWSFLQRTLRSVQAHAQSHQTGEDKKIGPQTAKEKSKENEFADKVNENEHVDVPHFGISKSKVGI